ncbi:MAG: hypothetical protein ISR58_08520 [Anaerolineales bacterium]|nr:hypothetical protein [Chloroflexota bacterium]MBL6981221.1 hypothetical protein [Anaerolineales bacterium]
MLRPLGWRDLPTLYRYRHQGVFLNSALVATRGTGLIPSVLFASLNPTSGFTTWVCMEDCDELPLMGQSIRLASSTAARLSFLAPREALESPSTQKLLEQLVQQAGKRGAFHLVAEVNTDSFIFENFRRAGFATYARQQIWAWDQNSNNSTGQPHWRIAQFGELPRLQALYGLVVPETIAHIEPLSASSFLPGLTYYKNNELIGFALVRYGGHGIWVKPYFLPDVQEIDQLLTKLITDIPDRRSRPIYFCVRAYQPLLAPTLEAMDAIPSPEQTVMVKHMAVHHKLRETFKLGNLNGHPETPLAQTQQNTYTSGEMISHASTKNNR